MEEGGKCSASPTHTTMLISDKENMIALIKQMGEALEELIAVVNGECPSLLNEDSDGSPRLIAQIDSATDAYNNWKRECVK